MATSLASNCHIKARHGSNKTHTCKCERFSARAAGKLTCRTLVKSASSHSEFRARFVGFVNANNHPAQDQKFFQPQYCIRILAFCDGDDSMSAARFLPRLHSACPQPAQPFQAVPNQRALVQHNEYSVMRTMNIRLSLQSELIINFYTLRRE